MGSVLQICHTKIFLACSSLFIPHLCEHYTKEKKVMVLEIKRGLLKLIRR